MTTANDPTASELAILQVLWRLGPITVRQVHAALEDGRGYTTILKLMQIMAAKELVKRDERDTAHVYSAAVSEAAAQRSLVKTLLDRAFDGSASRLLMAALAGKKTSSRELAELKALLDRVEKGER